MAAQHSARPDRDLPNLQDRGLARTQRASLRFATGVTILLGLCTPLHQARAQMAAQQGFLDPSNPGQPVGFAIEVALYACSVASIAGNALNIEFKNHQRGWMYSGFICGFINTILSPILIIYLQTPPVYGTTSGLLHGLIGATNLGVAIYNGALWHRVRTTKREPSKIVLAPFVGRDQLGASVLGLGVRLSGL